MARTLTCGTCDRSWSADAVYCGRCGDRLPSRRVPQRRRAAPRVVTPLVLVAMLLTGINWVAATREAAPQAGSDVDLPPAGEAATQAAVDVAPRNRTPRCRHDGRSSTCEVWTSSVRLSEPDPVYADGMIIAVENDVLVGIDGQSGAVVWRNRDVVSVAWLFATSPDDTVALVATDEQRLYVVMASTGTVTVTLDDVLPVFPGVHGQRLAVLSRDGTAVIDTTTGSVLLHVQGTTGRTSGRLTSSGFVSWDGSTLRVTSSLGGTTDEQDIWDVPVDRELLDAVASDGLIVAAADDGSLIGVDVSSRSIRWVSEQRGEAVSRPILTPGYVTFLHTDGSTVGIVTTIDAKTGEFVCTWPIRSDVDLRQDPSDTNRLLTITNKDDGLVVGTRSVCGVSAWSLDLPAATQPVVASGNRLFVRGREGAVLMDLRTGTKIFTFGDGHATPVDADPPLVVQDGILYRLDGNGLA